MHGSVKGSSKDLKRYEEALETFQKAIEIEPKNVEAWIGKGKSLNNLKRYEEALETFQEAIEIEPKNAMHGSVNLLLLVDLINIKSH